MSAPLSPEDRARLAELFDRAADLPSAERASFVARECGGNEALRDELTRLLAALEGEDVLERLQAAGVPPAGERAGTQIGPYRLLERIGEGGMGEVYAAEQQGPVARRVALKVIKPGMDSAQVVARFDAERQALARMTHPNIAHVYGGGATDDGRPYFVMELVDGAPITEHCDHEKLPTRARLELFLEVCEGVQHAHLKGIIHRDLKPSNLLVATQGGRAVPKVIDFGVARATTGRPEDRYRHTMVGQIVGTLDYMSPEQADASAVDIDTRSDLYSLGVVLYQLVSGVLPIEHTSAVDRSLAEMQRAIREEDPPTPSTRLRRQAGTATKVAPRHGTDERSLIRQLAGDLDWICLKALEKDPARRYQSASELADDLRRHLAHEPVLAGRPGALYRARKFIRRNKTSVVAALAVSLALFLGLAAALRFGLREQDQRRVAEGNSYRANLTVTLQALQEGNYDVAREIHDDAPDYLRGWEWRHLEWHWVQELARVAVPSVLDAAFVDEETVLVVDEVDDVAHVHVWNVLTGELEPVSSRDTLPAWPSPVRPLALSPDGRWLLAYFADELFLGDPRGTQPLHRIPFEKKSPMHGAGLSIVSRDGSRAAVVIKGNHLFLVGPGKEPQTIPYDPHEIHSVALDPRASLLAVRRKGWFRVWRLDPLERLWEEEVTYGAVGFSSDGATVAVELESDGGSGTGLLFKDAESGRLVRQLSREKYGAYHFRKSGALTFSEDQRLLALTFSHEGIFLLDASAGTEFAADSPVLAGRRSRRESVGRAEYGPKEDVIARFSPSGRSLLAVGINKEEVLLWRTGIDGASNVVRGHREPVSSVAFSHDGATIASGSADGEVRLWDPLSGEARGVLDVGGGIGGLAFAPDGTQLACASEGSLSTWDTAQGEAVAHRQGDYSGAIAYSPDGSLLVAGTRDGEIHIWEAGSLGEPRVLASGRTAAIQTLGFGDGGRLLATGSADANVSLWNPSTGARLQSMDCAYMGKASFQGALSLSFDARGSRLVVGWGDSSLSLLEVPSLEEIWARRDHRGEVFAVAFSPNGKRIASGGRDGFLRLWDADLGEPLLTLDEHLDYVRSLAFSPDESRPDGSRPDRSRIVTGSGDTTVRIWDSAPPVARWRERGEQVRAR